MSNSINGPSTALIAAVFTPMDSRQRLSLSGIPRQLAYFQSVGIDGVFIGGTTGEAPSLTVDERQRLAEAWCGPSANDSFQRIVHVGHHCQMNAIQLAEHAKDVGADAISAIVPGYFVPETVAAVTDCLAPVAAAAETLPFYYYHLPTITHCTLPIGEIVDRLTTDIPNFAGVKYSSLDLIALQDLLTRHPRLKIFYGNDETLLAAMSLGVRAAVGSTYNFAAPLFRRMIDEFDRGDLASAAVEQRLAVRVVQQLGQTGYLATAKELMSALDLHCGPVRPPLQPPHRKALNETIKRLHDWDVLTSAAEWSLE